MKTTKQTAFHWTPTISDTRRAEVAEAYADALHFVTLHFLELCSESSPRQWHPDSKLRALQALLEPISTSREEQRSIALLLVNTAARDYVAKHWRAPIRCPDCQCQIPA